MITNFSPFPTLHTERLTLRQLVVTDEPEIFVLRSDPRMLEFLNIVPAKTLEDVRPVMQRIAANIVDGTSVFWAIALKDSPKLIGTICLWNISAEQSTAEIGYMLHPDFQAKGYMQEALVAVLAYGSEVMQAQIIEGFCHPRHVASIRLLERNGFVRTGEVDGLAAFRRV